MLYPASRTLHLFHLPPIKDRRFTSLSGLAKRMIRRDVHMGTVFFLDTGSWGLGILSFIEFACTAPTRACESCPLPVAKSPLGGQFIEDGLKVCLLAMDFSFPLFMIYTLFEMSSKPELCKVLRFYKTHKGRSEPPHHCDGRRTTYPCISFPRHP